MKAKHRCGICKGFECFFNLARNSSSSCWTWVSSIPLALMPALDRTRPHHASWELFNVHYERKRFNVRKPCAIQRECPLRVKPGAIGAMYHHFVPARVVPGHQVTSSEPICIGKQAPVKMDDDQSAFCLIRCQKPFHFCKRTWGLNQCQHCPANTISKDAESLIPVFSAVASA
jgi:hypothetical protein